MRIIAIRERAVPVRSAMRNAAFDFSEMTTSIVAVITDVVRDNRPVVGYAFNSTGRYACGAAMRDRFIPRVLSAPPDELLDKAGLIDPAKVAARMALREKPGGDAERSVPIGTIETAVWDALAKALDRPLWHVIAKRYGTAPVRTAIPCYVGGGWYQPRDDLGALRDEVRRHLDDGYTCLKIKTGGVPLDDDCRRIDAVLAILGDASRLAVDANAALPLERAEAYAARLAPYGLRWLEEPCAPQAFGEFAHLAARYEPPLATGENLYCLADVENLLRFGGFRGGKDILQVDPPQAYGIAAYATMVRRVEAMGGSRERIFPHGGNMMSFAVAAGLSLGGCEAYPGVFGAFGGYAEGMRVTDGMLNLPDIPGIGFERQPALYALMQELAA
ncbi:MAG: mandelate racemase/muconate lactonizing enzyme family protein [Beijerinckiaceae bacterium]